MIVRGGCLLNYDCFANAEVCVLDVVRIRTKQFDHKAGHWLWEHRGDASLSSSIAVSQITIRFVFFSIEFSFHLAWLAFAYPMENDVGTITYNQYSTTNWRGGGATHC